MNNENMLVSFGGDFAIRSMLTNLHKLIAGASRLNLDTKKIEMMYKDLHVLNLFSNRHIVSISGLQSAGKTTLIKKFLGLPDDVLTSEVGVGEKRPVLISSSDTKHPLYRMIRMEKSSDKGFSMRQEAISKDELNEGVQNPREDVLWFEIVLPKNEKLGHITLALLPGFERSSRSDSQKFLELFLKCSTGMILVVNHARLAQMDQDNLLKRVADTYKDKSPGFVLTYASELSDEKRRAVEESLMEKFGDIQEGQVVLSDFDLDASNDIERLLRMNSSYTIDSNMMSANKMRMVGEELSMELRQLERVVAAHHSRSSESGMMSSVMQEFQIERERYMKELEDQLQVALNGHVGRCIDAYEESVAQEGETAFDKLKAAFKKDLTFKERRALTKSINKVYTQDSAVDLDYLILQSIEKTAEKTVKSMKRYAPKVQIASETAKYLEYFEPGEFSPTETAISPQKVLNDDFEDSLRAVDAYLDPVKTEVSLEARHVRLLPIVAGSILQGTILSMNAEGEKRVLEHGIEEYMTLKQKTGDLEGLQKEYKDVLMNTNLILRGSAIFLGVDAMDGTFNSFGAIVGPLQALGLSTAVAGATAGLGIGALFGLIAIAKGAEKIEKFKFDRAAYADKVIHATASYQKEHILGVVGGIMDDMQNQFRIAYEDRNQLKGDMGLYEEVTGLINRLQRDCGKLKKEAFVSASFVK